MLSITIVFRRFAARSVAVRQYSNHRASASFFSFV